MRPAATTFHIEGSRHPRPAADRTILADGADADRPRRPDDVELSHWVPNRTDERYKADTSTEICLRYVADPAHEAADLVVNDHLDIDGILSLYVLVHPSLALEHRATVAAAAAMGDFHAWSERPGFVLAQELWRTVTSEPVASLDVLDRCREGFGAVTEVLTGRRAASSETVAGWEHLQAGAALLEDGTVATTLVGERFASFVYPSTIPPEAAHTVPALNQLVDTSIAIWPQVRNRRYGQRLQLLSSPADRGRWRHELWAPGYCWAETPDRWTLPGLVSTGDSNRWLVDDDRLGQAVATLQDRDDVGVCWTLAKTLTPFASIDGRGFPILVSCLDDRGGLAASTLGPDEVTETLAPVWSDVTATG